MPDHANPPFPFALLPAAGRSRRMGAPKLLLDLGGQTVIARVLAALGQAGLTNRLVVVSPLDHALEREVETHGGQAIVPADPPPEMKDSIAFGLRHVARDLEIRGERADLSSPWLLIPADHPVVEARIVRVLLDAAARNPGAIIVPTHAGRRGHPTVFAWKHALAEGEIPAGEGFNWITKRNQAEVIEIAVDTASVLVDLDTPADYERLRVQWNSSP